MKKIDWVRKLTSRKMWTAVASFVSMMIVATGGTENTATQVWPGHPLWHISLARGLQTRQMLEWKQRWK